MYKLSFHSFFKPAEALDSQELNAQPICPGPLSKHLQCISYSSTHPSYFFPNKKKPPKNSMPQITLIYSFFSFTTKHTSYYIDNSSSCLARHSVGSSHLLAYLYPPYPTSPHHAKGLHQRGTGPRGPPVPPHHHLTSSRFHRGARRRPQDRAQHRSQHPLEHPIIPLRLPRRILSSKYVPSPLHTLPNPHTKENNKPLTKGQMIFPLHQQSSQTNNRALSAPTTTSGLVSTVPPSSP